MERYKRRFSFDAPTPYATPRRQSEPVVMGSSELSVGQPRLNRRYSTAAHTPESKLQALPESLEIAKQQKYSTNQEVRRLSMSIALQEALAEEYGFTRVYRIPIVYTPPPDKLYTSTHTIQLSIPNQRQKRDAEGDKNNNSGDQDININT